MCLIYTVTLLLLFTFTDYTESLCDYNSPLVRNNESKRNVVDLHYGTNGTESGHERTQSPSISHFCSGIFKVSLNKFSIVKPRKSVCKYVSTSHCVCEKLIFSASVTRVRFVRVSFHVRPAAM